MADEERETGQIEENPEGVPEATLQEIAEDNDAVAVLEQEISGLKRELAGREEEAEALRRHLARALERYRSLLLSGAPEVPAELVKGETLEALEESFATAKALVERVRREVEARLQHERVPPGSPPRRALDLSGLSPHEKILLGLRHRG